MSIVFSAVFPFTMLSVVLRTVMRATVT
jgi:hypothetical protein